MTAQLTDMLARVEGLRGILEAHADTNELECQVAPEVYSAMTDQDLFAMTTPSAHGGLEMDLVDVLQVVEAVCAIDGASGWNLNQSLSMTMLMGWFPGALDAVFEKPNVILAGALWPPAPAVRVDGGIRVTGRMPFVSGGRFASWALGPAMVMNADEPAIDPETGEPEFMGCLYSIDDMTFTEDWDPTGMRGTGSNDALVEDVFVPDARTVHVPGVTSRPLPDVMANPNYAIAPFAGISLHAIVPVGIVQGALRDIHALIADKVPNYFEVTLRDRGTVQAGLAEATAGIAAARSYIITATADAVEQVRSGPLSVESRIDLQLAACNAATATTRALDLIGDIAGTSAIKRGRPLERRVRDARTIIRHVAMQAGRYESAGMAMVGQESDWFPFNV